MHCICADTGPLFSPAVMTDIDGATGGEAQSDCIKIIAARAHLRGSHYKNRHVCVAQKSNCQYNKEVREPYVCLLH